MFKNRDRNFTVRHYFKASFKKEQNGLKLRIFKKVGFLSTLKMISYNIQNFLKGRIITEMLYKKPINF